ncbi:hypothetical protein ES703_34046 [subsurface metagenome]
MLIGLLSDTHIREVTTRVPEVGKTLPAQIKDVFRGVDLILHAGDIYITSVLHELAHIAPVLAAKGDDDDGRVVDDKRVKIKHTININGTTIWLAHQYELWPWDEHERPPDVIVFGHTHEAALENHGGVLLVNPGSPTFPHYQYELGTVGLLTINSGKAEAQIVQLR